MSDFLLELLSEEIPARMQAGARNALAKMFAEGAAAAGLETGAIETFSTPRRLVLIARDLASATSAAREEIKGPRSAAPPQALEGFLRKTGLAREQLEEREGIFFAVIERPGRAAAEIIAVIVRGIIADFAWPKSMRWGDGSMRWVRPLHGIVALLGEDIVPIAVEGIESGAATLGHRFHHPGPITIGGAHDYAEKLRACHVIVDHQEREGIIREGAAAAASAAGFTLVADEGLVVENAGLTEWPVPLLGRFDGDFLDVPREVIVLTMRTNQKYFACVGADGALAPAFVCTANIDASDGGASIVEGNRRVLAARLSDARFFWEQDLKVPLDEQAKKLSGIVFHEKLGTVADKVERVAKLARWLVEQHIVTPAQAGAQRNQEKLGSRFRGNDEEVAALADQAERAARLAKADLVTGMVGEFPELQGVIGGYLAAAQGEPKAVADAVRDHYKPIGQSDEVPTAPVTVAVSLADKLDTLGNFFFVGEFPTGSKDPFALRRAAISIIRLIVENDLRLSLPWTVVEPIMARAIQVVAEREGENILSDLDALKRLGLDANLADVSDDHKKVVLSEDWLRKLILRPSQTAAGQVLEFFAERLKVQQREAGVRHDLIDAVFALGGEDDLVRLLARVKALQAFVETEEGANLLAAYKRTSNILKKERWEPKLASDADYFAQELALFQALQRAAPAACEALGNEDFAASMSALSTLRGPIDIFFDGVTVNADDPGVRARRLNLLASFRDAVDQVADFSKIEG